MGLVAVLFYLCVKTEFYSMQQQRKKIGAVTLILIGLAIGFAIKNVKIGLLLGLVLGVLAGGLLRNSK